MKSKRQSKILEIVENSSIETQEELISKLREAGYTVTQATISRDIRELKLTKVMSETGSKYIVPQAVTDDGQHIYSKALTASIKSVEASLNLVVVRTYPGMANAVAAGIDSLKSDDILGCVAGDDTIIVVTGSEEHSAALKKKLEKITE